MLPPSIYSTSKSQVSTSAFKQGVETILNGRKKLDLDLFPRHWRGLNEIFNAIYRRLIGIDARAEQLIRSQKSQIVKAMLRASLCNSTQVISFGDPDSANQTSFGICRRGGNQVCFFQFVSGSKTQIADMELIEIDPEKFKTDCVRAYIQSEHEEGGVADLSDINLRDINVDDIQFERTKITCDSFKYLSEQCRPVSLFGAEVVGNIPTVDVSYLNFRIDKVLALQLIKSGADRRMVLHQFLKTAHDSNLKNIDLSGFDIRGLDLDSFDFRHVNFRDTLVRPSDRILTESEQQHLVLDKSILRNIDGGEPLFDPSARDLISSHISGSVVLRTVPEFLIPLNQADEFTLSQFVDFADKIDVLNDDGVYFRNLHMENIRLFNGKIHYIDGVTVFEKWQDPDDVMIEQTAYVPIHTFETFRVETFDRDKRAKTMEMNYRKLDQYCFFVTMMGALGLDPHPGLTCFEGEIEKFVEALMPQEKIGDEGRKLREELINFLEKPLEHSLSCSLKTYLTVPNEFPNWYANSYFATGDSALVD